MAKNSVNLPSTDQALEALRGKGLAVTVRRHSYGVPHIAWSPNDKGRKLIIGSYCSIAEGVSIYVGIQGRHTTDFLSTYPMGMIYRTNGPGEVSRYHAGNLDVAIGSDVWIGREALILAGVTIGDGAVIGARSIVTKDVPPYAVAAGAPAKVVRYRFPGELIQRLLDLKWWSLPEALLREHIQLFSTSDVETSVAMLEALASPFPAASS